MEKVPIPTGGDTLGGIDRSREIWLLEGVTTKGTFHDYQEREARQSPAGLIPRAKSAVIPLSEHHPMVVLTDALDWTEMEVRAEKIRAKKLKNAAGRPLHLRALLGALTVMAIRRLPYRETEEQIRYYAPARYLCGLPRPKWTPDFTTIQDFSQLLGDGVKLINEYVVELAVELGLANPRLAVADTTAQEAAIPHPTEMGLLGNFLRSVGTVARTAGRTFKRFLSKVSSTIKGGKKRVRAHRLFAKTADARRLVLVQLTKVVEGLNGRLGKAISEVSVFRVFPPCVIHDLAPPGSIRVTCG